MADARAMDIVVHMRAFVRVVDAGSLSAAARQLRLSLPAVSRQLAALEADLGVTLIVRSTRRLSVTEAGRAYYERATRVLAQVDEARESVRHRGQVRGTLVVSAPVTLGLVRLAPHLPALFAKYPGLEVDLRLDDRAVDLVSEGVDVAIRAGIAPPDSGQVMAWPVMRWRRVLVASPSYLRRKGEPRTTDGLARHAALINIPASGRAGIWHLEVDGAPVTVHVRGPLRTNALAALLDACRAGSGIAFLPEWLVAPDLAAKRLKRVLPSAASSEITVHAIYRREHRQSVLMRTFIEFLAGI